MKGPGTARTLWKSEVLVSELVGRLIEFWGFKRNMGRVWAVLYLSQEPLCSRDLQQALRLSSGAVSMTVNGLLHWGVVKKVWVVGQRRAYFTAEAQLWKMIRRVLSEREGGELAAAIEGCEEALASLEPHLAAADQVERERAHLQKTRIVALLELVRLGQRLLDALVATAKVDAEPLSRVDLRR